MENSFKNLIDSSNDILILLPSKPFLDQVAAGLSLFLSLKQESKMVTISCPASMTVNHSRLVGIDQVTTSLGGNNLVITLKNYPVDNVDKVNYDLESGEFKLTISPKSGVPSPTKEQLEISQSGVGGDLVILVGGINDSHHPFLSKPEFKGKKILHVGTKLLEVHGIDIEVLSFARPASSTSEVVARLLKESGFTVDQDIASNLLSGIEDQSKGFQSADVTADTFEVFADLLKLGGRRMLRNFNTRPFPPGSIPNKPFNQPQVVENNFQPIIKNDEKAGNMTYEEAEQEIQQDIPPSWSEPKIFTGNSIS